MPLEWVTMTDLARECGIHPRTFRNNYLGSWPPDREVGDRRWWKRSTANKIKAVEFNIKIEAEEMPVNEDK